MDHFGQKHGAPNGTTTTRRNGHLSTDEIVQRLQANGALKRLQSARTEFFPCSVRAAYAMETRSLTSIGYDRRGGHFVTASHPGMTDRGHA
jgi:hypothetical protein